MNYVAEIGKKNKAERIAAEALSRPLPPGRTRPQFSTSGSMTYPPRQRRVRARQ